MRSRHPVAALFAGLAVITTVTPAMSADVADIQVPRDPHFLAIEYIEEGGYGIRNASGEETSVVFRTRVFGDGRVVLRRPDKWNFTRDIEYYVSPEQVQASVRRLAELGSLDYERHIADSEVDRLSTPGVFLVLSDRGVCDLKVRGVRNLSGEAGADAVVENTMDLSAVGYFSDRFPESEVLQNLRRARELVKNQYGKPPLGARQ